MAKRDFCGQKKLDRHGVFENFTTPGDNKMIFSGDQKCVSAVKRDLLVENPSRIVQKMFVHSKNDIFW